MEYESLMDIDEVVIVRLDKFYLGNIFIDDGMIAICKIGKDSLEVDISKKTSIDLSTLIDLFEDKYSQDNFELIEIYEEGDCTYLAKDCIAKIPHRSVQRYCMNTLKQLEQVDDLGNKIKLLNQLLSDSLLTPEKLPSPEKECLYHTTRNLFVAESKRSNKDTTIYRFTVAKRVYDYLIKGDDYSVKIELIDSNSKVRFHVYENLGDREIKMSESRRLFNNNDGSVRANMAPAAYEWISNPDNEFELYIDIKNDELIFSLCE